MALVGYPKVIPYAKFEHFEIIRFRVMPRILVWEMHLLAPWPFNPETTSLLWYPKDHSPYQVWTLLDHPFLSFFFRSARFFCCSPHQSGTLYWLTLDCARAFPHSSATWKPICSGSLSPSVLQAPLYLRTSRRYTNVLLGYYYAADN